MPAYLGGHALLGVAAPSASLLALSRLAPATYATIGGCRPDPVVTLSNGDALDLHTTVAVRDRGVGIPHEELPHIFTPFYRASTARGIPGTGIGLSRSKMIVEQHGGQITVESAVGQGTTVVLRLPGP